MDEGDADREAAFRMAAEPFKKVTVFELRGGLVQDVLPPSIHPGTRKPYIWRTPPASEGLPELPADLLAIWQDWDEFKPKGRAFARGNRRRQRLRLQLFPWPSHQQLQHDLVIGSPRLSLNSIASMTSQR